MLFKYFKIFTIVAFSLTGNDCASPKSVAAKPSLYQDYVRKGKGYSTSSSSYNSGCGGYALSAYSAIYPYVDIENNNYLGGTIEASKDYPTKMFFVSKLTTAQERAKLINVYRIVSQIEYFNQRGSLKGIVSEPNADGNFSWFSRDSFSHELGAGKKWKILNYGCDKCTKCNGSGIDLFKDFGRGVQCGKCKDGKLPYHLMVCW
jgi:hypothetical protein